MNSKNTDILTKILNFRVMHQLDTKPEELNSIVIAHQSHGYQIVSDSGGQMLGYLIVCKICRYSIQNLINNGVIARYSYEWNEGKFIYIDAICLKYSDFSSTIQWIKNFIKENKYIFYIRRNCLFFVRYRNNKIQKKLIYRFGNK